MSLVVWLPLTKDLRQQGLANTSTITLASGNAFVDGGKVGNKALHLTKQQTILGTSSCMSGKKQMSYAFWVKVNTAWSAQWLDGIAWYSTDGSSAAYSRQEFYTNCTRIGTWFSGSSLSGYVFTPGEWTHIAGTFDYTAGIAKFYINGVLQGTSTSLSKTHYCRGDFYIGDNGVDIVENDVRIYDHCLSPMEVKELAKGLVLHYPLNRQGWGQENLVVNTGVMATISNVCNYRIDSGCSVTNGIGRLSGDGGWRAIGVHNGLKLADYQNKTVTISVDIKAETTGATYRPIIEFRTNNTAFGTTRTWRYRTINLTATDGTTIPTTEWKRFTCTVILQTGFFTAYDNADMNVEPDWANGYWGIHCYNHSSIYYNIKNIKLELGSIATPWCPNSSDALATTMGLNSTVEYDCSGFCNNGSKGGSTISYTSDTPKYAVSTQLIGTTVDTSSNTKTGAAYITGPCSLSNITALTVTWWAKIRKYGRGGIMDLTSWTSNYEEGTDYNTCPLSNWDSTFRLWDGTNAFNFFSYVLKDSTWHHYAVTFTSGSGKFYRDGVNIASSGTMGNTLTNFNGVRTGLGKAGGVYRQIDEDVSDLRIYATALSADDVKSLYQNSAYIDSSGNVYGAVHSEA